VKKGGTKLPDVGGLRREMLGKLDKLRNAKISPKQANQAANRAGRKAGKVIKPR